MLADAGGRPLAKDVDEVRWVWLDEAVAMVTYDRDREVLERARPLLVVGERHTSHFARSRVNVRSRTPQSAPFLRLQDPARAL